MADQILEFIIGLSPIGLHLFFFLAAFIEVVFPPWPGDTFIAFAGFLTAHSVIEIGTALITTGLGSIVGALVMYFAGSKILDFARKLHTKLKPGFIQNLLNELVADEQMQKATEWFNKYGVWFVLFSRFSAGIRFFVSIIAGISKMNLALFTVFFAFGVVIWNGLLLIGGRLLAENWRQMLEWLKLYNLFIGFILVAVIGYLLYRRWQKKHDSSNEQ